MWLGWRIDSGSLLETANDGRELRKRDLIGNKPRFNLVYGDTEHHPRRWRSEQPFAQVWSTLGIRIQIPQHKPRSVSGGRFVAIQRVIQPVLAAFRSSSTGQAHDDSACPRRSVVVAAIGCESSAIISRRRSCI